MLWLLHELPGVYAIKHSRMFPRLLGATDILYIGSTTGTLRNRIYQYYHCGETQFTNCRIRHCVDELGCFEMSYITCLEEDTRSTEQEILLKFEMEHLELPPLNRGYNHWSEPNVCLM